MLALVGVGVAAWFFVVAWKYKKHQKKIVITRGMNALSSGGYLEKTLVCPPGKTISVDKASIGCADTTTGSAGALQPASGCDPMKYNGTPDSATTQSGVDLVNAQCKGKGICDLKIPTANLDLGSCTSCNVFELIGTYDCVS